MRAAPTSTAWETFIPADPALRELARKLRYGTPGDREEAARVLADHGACAAPYLIHLGLEDVDKGVRRAAAQALCRIAGPGVPEAALDGVEATEPEIRLLLEVAQARCGGRDEVALLAQRLEDVEIGWTVEFMREFASWTGDRRSDSDAVPAVIGDLLEDAPAESESRRNLLALLSQATASRCLTVRLNAVIALGRSGGTETAGGLVAAMRRGRPGIRIVEHLTRRVYMAIWFCWSMSMLFTVSVGGGPYPRGPAALIMLGGLLACAVSISILFVTKKLRADRGSIVELEQCVTSMSAVEPSLLVEALPELRIVASSYSGLSNEGRKAARGLIRQIEGAYAERGSLPVVGHAPDLATETLPRPADGPALEVGTLPLAGSEPRT